MRPEDDFEETAQILFKLVRGAIDKYPGQPRVLKFWVTGHRTEEGGFDQDAWELISNFIPGVLSPHLTEFINPFVHVRMNEPQDDCMPLELRLHPGDITTEERAKLIADAEAKGIPMHDADEFERQMGRR